MSKKHIEVVAGIIVDNNLIYITKRSGNDEFKNLYEFPGGKIEKGETKVEALKRELKEELDLEIINPTFYKQINHKYETLDVSLYLYICNPVSTNIKLNVHSFGEWVTLEELKNKVELFLEADQKMIKEIKKGDLKNDQTHCMF